MGTSPSSTRGLMTSRMRSTGRSSRSRSVLMSSTTHSMTCLPTTKEISRPSRSLYKLFLLALNRVDTDLFVILLQSGQIFPGLTELTLFHTFTDIPVNESSLGVHQVKLVVQSSPGLSNSGGVAQHANSSLDFGQISAWNDGWWLVVDTDFETGWAPVNKLDGSLGLDGSDGGVDVLWYNITSVQHAASHVFTVSRIALDHLVGWLEASVGDFGDGKLLVVSFLGGDNWSVGDQWKVNSWVWYQVGLELG